MIKIHVSSEEVFGEPRNYLSLKYRNGKGVQERFSVGFNVDLASQEKLLAMDGSDVEVVSITVQDVAK